MTHAGHAHANIAQQDYFADVATKAMLPLFKERDKPFVLVFWSRDPDGTQHNQGDSLNTLVPGINGPTSLAGDPQRRRRSGAAARGAERARPRSTPPTSSSSPTTASRPSPRRARPARRRRSSFADTPAGFLPLGFVALDLAQALELPLIDPDDNYAPIAAGQHTKARQRPDRRRHGPIRKWWSPPMAART